MAVAPLAAPRFRRSVHGPLRDGNLARQQDNRQGNANYASCTGEMSSEDKPSTRRTPNIAGPDTCFDERTTDGASVSQNGSQETIRDHWDDHQRDEQTHSQDVSESGVCLTGCKLPEIDVLEEFWSSLRRPSERTIKVSNATVRFASLRYVFVLSSLHCGSSRLVVQLFVSSSLHCGLSCPTALHFVSSHCATVRLVHSATFFRLVIAAQRFGSSRCAAFFVTSHCAAVSSRLVALQFHLVPLHCSSSRFHCTVVCLVPLRWCFVSSHCIEDVS
ncbi:unnamed protein product [Heligmosomoides polygyrus]|uniref:Polyketide synthase n=1 Tax=Heligmosomoides polygyrus TaxID=6339 RepID=A0A183GIR7_HELPZ|nr:unnamed protein product [Heligmosomoides polygyrus]